MYSSRLAGAQQPTVLLSLKSHIITTLSLDLVAAAHFCKTNAWQTCCWEQNDPPVSLASRLRKVSTRNHLLTSTYHFGCKLHLLFTHLLLFLLILLQQEESPTFPVCWKLWKAPKHQQKPMQVLDPNFPQISKSYYCRQGQILPSGLWHWTVKEVLQVRGQAAYFWMTMGHHRWIKENQRMFPSLSTEKIWIKS